jgi:hypothetical protein
MKHRAIMTYTGINIFPPQLLFSTRFVLILQSHFMPEKKKFCANLKWPMLIHTVFDKLPRSVVRLQHTGVRLLVLMLRIILFSYFICYKLFSFLLSVPINVIIVALFPSQIISSHVHKYCIPILQKVIIKDAPILCSGKIRNIPIP